MMCDVCKHTVLVRLFEDLRKYMLVLYEWRHADDAVVDRDTFYEEINPGLNGSLNICLQTMHMYIRYWNPSYIWIILCLCRPQLVEWGTCSSLDSVGSEGI